MHTLTDYTATYTGNQADGNSTNHYGHNITNVQYHGGPDADECLRDLRLTDPRDDKARIEDDKDGLLRDCYAWILDDVSFQRWKTQDESRLLWIKGDPGKGKTMMTMGVISELDLELKSQPCLLAYFFCQSTMPELNNAVSVLRGLIYMLVTQREQLMRHVQQQYKATGSRLFEGPNAIYALKRILSDILNDTSISATYLLVDALDECDSGRSELLRIITDDRLAPSRVKWLVTSRNLPQIEQDLQSDTVGIRVSLEISANHVSKAVAVFVDFKVQGLAIIKYDVGLQIKVQQLLRDKAEGTFLWVSLVCKELEKVPRHSMEKMLEALPPGLNPLYERMMAQIVAQDAGTVRYCKEILRSVRLAFRPLQLEELAVTAGLPKDQFGNVQAVADLVSRCGSFLTMREGVVSFIHLSAKDFFTLGHVRQVFDETPAEEQGRMTDRLLDAMDSTLRRDMCNLQKPGVRIQEVIATRCIADSCLPQVAYACEYWVEHLQAGEHACSDMLADGGRVHSFFQKHLLHWLEAMSLLQRTPEAILALQQLETALNGAESAMVSQVVHDALRFAMWSGYGIQEAPLQVYYGALVFSPQQSIVRHQFRGELPEGVKMRCGLDEDWGPLLQTLEGRTDEVNSVAFSVTGDRLASASSDKTVRVWDARTGQLLQTIKGHVINVKSVAFSAAGDRLASGAHDKTVRVWDAWTGLLLHTFNGHTGSVSSVAFSAAGDRLASASSDKTVRVWDVKIGQSLQMLNGHTDWVIRMAFSAAGDRLASASHDNTVRVWDAKTGQPLHTLENTGHIASLAFSSDGSCLETSQGVMLLPPPAQSTSTLVPWSSAQRIFVAQRWLTADAEEMLWIPADYVPSCTASYNCRAALGYNSGKMLFLELS